MTKKTAFRGGGVNHRHRGYSLRLMTVLAEFVGLTFLHGPEWIMDCVMGQAGGRDLRSPEKEDDDGRASDDKGQVEEADIFLFGRMSHGASVS